MTTGFFIGLAAIFVFDTILGGVLGFMARNEKYQQYRIHIGRNPIAERKRTMSIILNYTTPQLMYGGFLYFLGNRLLYTGLPNIAMLALSSTISPNEKRRLKRCSKLPMPYRSRYGRPDLTASSITSMPIATPISARLR